MPDESKPKFEWVRRQGIAPEFYCNSAHLSWTLVDVRVQIGQLLPSKDRKTFEIEEVAGVTFAWPQAKNLRDALSGLIDSYEKANGEITSPKLAADPSLSQDPSESGSEKK